MEGDLSRPTLRVSKRAGAINLGRLLPSFISLHMMNVIKAGAVLMLISARVALRLDESTSVLL